jgi:O-acetyl-ADP-ribose deacetylase (regulator of RNase III)
MPLNIVKSDITRIQADAIVNAASSTLQNSGGVCDKIYAASGADELQKACNKIGSCKTGSAVATEGFALSKYIIHTVGPVWQGGDKDERNTLYACYRNSLTLAKKHNCESIAFPLISSGANGYPPEKALRVAVKAIGDFLRENDMSVSLVIYGGTKFLSEDKQHSEVRRFIRDNYTDKISRSEFESIRDAATAHMQPSEPKPSGMIDVLGERTRAAFAREADRRRLDDIVVHVGETFQQMLFRLIDERKLSDPEVYRRANIDRRVFAAIRRPNYQPSKNTAMCLAIALELSLDVTLDLLGRAGLTLSPSSVQDLIVTYFIKEKIYDIHKINEALFHYDQNLLGATAR